MIQMQIGHTRVVAVDPTHLEKLRQGKPLVLKFDREPPTKQICVCYCPDVGRLAGEVRDLSEPHLSDVIRLLEHCQDWPERS